MKQLSKLTSSTDQQPWEEFTSSLRTFIDDHTFAFDVFARLKQQPNHLLRINFLTENQPEQLKNGIKRKIENEIIDELNTKFLSPTAIFALGNNVADGQDKFYFFPQQIGNEILTISDACITNEFFSIKQASELDSLLFRFHNHQLSFWAYQAIWPITFLKRKFQLVELEGSIFREATLPAISLNFTFDLILYKNYLITNNIKLLENRFKFSDYIYQSSLNVLSTIDKSNLVTDTAKFKQYISRDTRYSKRLLRCKNSYLFGINQDILVNSINASSRWSKLIKIDEASKKIIISTYDDVKNFIDLFDERFTRSDISHMEYDTSSKTIVLHS